MVFRGGNGGVPLQRMIDVPRASRVLAESCLGSLFSYLGLRGRAVLTRAEGGSVSIGSRRSVLTSSTFNTANLFTNSDQDTLFAGRTKQNPPPGGVNFLFFHCILQGHQIFDQFFPLLHS